MTQRRATAKFTMPRLTAELVEHYRRAGFWRDVFIDSFVQVVAERSPGKVAVVDRDRRITYGELERQISRFAACLRAHGLQDHDVVSFQLPNWIEAVIVHHGTLRAGGVSNPIVPIYRQREVGFILRQAHSRFVVAPVSFRGFSFAEMHEELGGALDTLEHLWFVGPDAAPDRSYGHVMETSWEITEHTEAVASLPRSPNDPALLLYTSGTTADPKGVIHTHNTLDYENRTIIELMRLTDADITFMPSPVTHITGVLYGLQLPSMLDSSVVFQDIWDPAAALELVARERCTFAVGATPFLHGMTYHPQLDEFDVSSLRVFACGGADVPPTLIEDASEHLCAAVRVYGSTEYPTLSASGPDAPLEKRSKTDGHLIADAEARTVDDSGKDVPAGGVGELVVRGPEMFVGYLAAEDDPFTADGWFATGDLAAMGSDGYVEIKGRKKDIILRGGENISAKEIEDLLFTHPKVREVAVVAYPDPAMTERACAVVVPEPGEHVELAELVAFLKSHQLATQKCPERIQVVEALPKTASGKVQKFKLRDGLRRETAS
jgi:cyclohexanecarboxylate-CoA ligase